MDNANIQKKAMKKHFLNYSHCNHYIFHACKTETDKDAGKLENYIKYF